MKIDALAHALPSEKLANDDVIQLFRTASNGKHTPSAWSAIERNLAGYLKMSGSQGRYLAAPDESPIDLAVTASRKALERAGKSAADVDLLIYASVSRGWLEPSMAVGVQKKLQATNATSFDVVDACASWLRAMHVAYGLLASGAYANALIVSVEAGMSDFIHFDIADAKILERYGAASTLGNTATATLVSATAEDDFYFVFRTFADDMDLCMMPLDNFATFLPELESQDLIPNKFMARSTVLLRKTLCYLVETFNNDSYLRRKEFDIMLSHAVSVGLARFFCRAANLPVKAYFGTYAEYGNTAAASIPLAMSLALESGRLKRGDSVGIGLGSAGITVGIAAFTF